VGALRVGRSSAHDDQAVWFYRDEVEAGPPMGGEAEFEVTQPRVTCYRPPPS
jgi:hypothetical protein